MKPMLCKDDLDKYIKANGLENTYASLKKDGVRCLAHVGPDSVTYTSRNEKTFPNFNVFDEELIAGRAKLLKWATRSVSPDAIVIYDGEVTAEGFSDVMSQVRRLHEVDSSRFRFEVFDIITPTAPDAPFSLRYALIGQTLYRGPKVCRLEHSVLFDPSKEAVEYILNQAINVGHEGLVLKDGRSLYQPGKKSIDWCKLKLFDTLDLPVIGIQPGKGKHEGRVGALVCDLGNGKTVEVGTGFSDAQREEFLREPPAMIEVKYQEKTKDSLRFPSFVRVREDK